MERAKWTDERLDERMAVIDERFERGLEEMRAMRQEMHAGFMALRGDLSAFQRQVTNILAGFAIALLGVLTAAAAITAATLAPDVSRGSTSRPSPGRPP